MARLQRRMSKEERKRDILKSAEAIFASKGYSGASIDDIAKAAGISNAIFYRHFASKKHAFDELIQIFFSGYYSVLNENHVNLAVAFAYKRTAEEVLNIWFDNILRILHYHYDNPNLTTIVFEKAIGSDEDISNRIRAHFATVVNMIAEEYRMSAKNGTLRISDIEFAAQFSIGSVFWLITVVDKEKWKDLNMLAYRILEYHAKALAIEDVGNVEDLLERFLAKIQLETPALHHEPTL